MNIFQSMAFQQAMLNTFRARFATLCLSLAAKWATPQTFIRMATKFLMNGSSSN